MMAYLSTFLLLLSCVFLHSFASPARLPRRAISSPSTLVVTAPTGTHPVVTFYPSHVSDRSSWPISTPTTITVTEVVGPKGYEWITSTAPPFQPPTIPSDPPYPKPGNLSSTLYSTASNGTAGSSSVIGTGASKSSPTASLGSGASGSNSVPLGTRASVPYPITGSGSPGPSSIGETVSPSAVGTGAWKSSDTLAPSETRAGTFKSAPLGTGVSASESAPPGTGVLPFPTSSSASSAASSDSTVPFSGSWSDLSTEPTKAFPFFLVPTTTVAGATATSEAAMLAGLFSALHANRQWIIDSKLRSQYVDAVKNTKAETLALINVLDVELPADPKCLNTKRKRSVILERSLRSLILDRSLISGITDLIGNAATLLSCAVQVVDNLVKAVEAPVPSIAEIETLTDTLAEFGENLQRKENDHSKSTSQTEPSSTEQFSSISSTSPSSCTESTAASHCTETLSLSTLYLSGATASYKVETITSTDCTTITECSAARSTATTTASTSSFTGGFVCSPTCLVCMDDSVTPKKTRRSEPLNKRTLITPEDYYSVDEFIRDEIPRPGGTELNHRPFGTLSSALSSDWINEAKHLYLVALFGCTSVVIVSEAGAWFSHHWEGPSFIGSDALFQTQVTNPIRYGDGPKMPSPFPLADAGKILSSGTNVQIFILTPKDPSSGELLFADRVGQIESTLTGPGSPFTGISITIQGYIKLTWDESHEPRHRASARGKVFIQYDNNQVDDPPKPQQQAIWRVWLEDHMYEHRWDATDVQKGGSCANSGNHKRRAGASCSKPWESSLPSGVSTGPIGSAGSLTSVTGPSITSAASSPVSPSSTFTSPVDSRSTITSNIPGPTSSSATPSSTFSLTCYPFSDPDAGPAPLQCQCDGLDGKFPYLSSTAGATNFNPCGYTSLPAKVSIDAAPPFTTTESNGEVMSCASSTYYNIAVNTIPICAGSTAIVSTVASIASAYSVAATSSASAASASAASASVTWASAAAVPSADCWILADDGFGDSAFEVYGINGWAGSDGSKLFDQEEGCGILSGFEFHTDGHDVFEGRLRDTQYVYFGLSFFKGGCVERAVHSAGGPPPGNGPGQLACRNGPGLSDTQLKAVNNVVGAQVEAVKAVADGGSAGMNTPPTNKEAKLAVDASASALVLAAESQSDRSLVALASAALPHLLAAQSTLLAQVPAQNASFKEATG